MKTQSDKTAEHNHKGVAHTPVQTQLEKNGELEFVDKRPEANVLATQLKMIQHSPRVVQLNAVQEMINTSVNKVAQLAHARKEEELPGTAQKAESGKTMQFALRNTVPNGTQIIIDNFNAPDFRCKGRIVGAAQDGSEKIVEFEDDPGHFYGVALHEMSAVNAAVQRDHGDEARTQATFANQTHAVTIICTMNVTSNDSQTADFDVYNGDVQIAKLELENTRRGFLLNTIKTNMSPDDAVPGIGVLLMKIAAEMALKFGQDNILLAAQKQTDVHPAPFYHKWGFRFTGATDPIALAKEMGLPFDEYINMTRENVLEMRARTRDVDQSTGTYLGQKQWH